MTSTESIPPDARHMAEQWLAVHDEVAPGLVEGLYLVGSLALDDWQPRSDIDVVVFTADPATESDAAALEAAHAIAVGRLADVRPGTNVDGPRLAWGDVSVPPMALHRPWTLDGAFHHDGECFELNPVTWHTLAARGVAVRGPEAPDLGVALDEHELRALALGCDVDRCSRGRFAARGVRRRASRVVCARSRPHARHVGNRRRRVQDRGGPSTPPAGARCGDPDRTGRRGAPTSRRARARRPRDRDGDRRTHVVGDRHHYRMTSLHRADVDVCSSIQIVVDASENVEKA